MLYWSYTRHCNENPGQNEENEDLGERQFLRGILVHEVMEEILRENIGSSVLETCRLIRPRIVARLVQEKFRESSIYSLSEFEEVPSVSEMKNMILSGIRMIASKFPRFQITSVEQEFDSPPIRGIIDLILSDNSQFIVLDWKTGQRKPNTNNNLQMGTYVRIVKELESTANVGAFFALIHSRQKKIVPCYFSAEFDTQLENVIQSDLGAWT